MSSSNIRKKILDVAARLFAEKGYNNTSVRDIAAELGIANPSLYYHFESKGAILNELLVEPMAVAEAAIKEAQTLMGEARTRRIIEGLLESLEVHSGIAITAFRNDGALPAEHQQVAMAKQSKIRDLLAQDVPLDNQRLRLTMAIGAVHAAEIGLLQQSETGDDAVAQLRTNRDTIVDLVMRLLS